MQGYHSVIINVYIFYRQNYGHHENIILITNISPTATMIQLNITKKNTAVLEKQRSNTRYLSVYHYQLQHFSYSRYDSNYYK